MAYVYDDLDRLTDADRDDGFDQSWTLDGMGNFAAFDDDGSSQTRSTNKANEITDITGGWVTPEYDRAGNLIFGPKSGDETTGMHFVRDAWNRQVAVYEDDGDEVFEPETDDTLIGEYEFDGVNRRIEKELSESHAHYYYNYAWQLLEERFVDGQGDPIEINQHVFSARYIDSPIVWLHDDNGDGDLLDVGDLVRYYLSDANHNTTAVFDSATGEVVNRYVYSAYGTHTVYDANWSNPTAPTADGIMYSGYWHDLETGNYHVRAREYITSLSTFDVRDPMGYGAGDMNLYRYVGGNPITLTDPSGMVVEEPTIFFGSGYTENAFGAYDGRVEGGYDVTLPNDDVVHVEQYGILIIHPNWCNYDGMYIGHYHLYAPSIPAWSDIYVLHIHRSGPYDAGPGFWSEFFSLWGRNIISPWNMEDVGYRYGTYAGWGMIVIGGGGLGIIYGAPVVAAGARSAVTAGGAAAEVGATTTAAGVALQARIARLLAEADQWTQRAWAAARNGDMNTAKAMMAKAKELSELASVLLGL